MDQNTRFDSSSGPNSSNTALSEAVFFLSCRWSVVMVTVWQCVTASSPVFFFVFFLLNCPRATPTVWRHCPIPIRLTRFWAMNLKWKRNSSLCWSSTLPRRELSGWPRSCLTYSPLMSIDSSSPASGKSQTVQLPLQCTAKHRLE